MEASTARSPRLSGPERREQILDATKQLAGERGFHGISIDAVARRAGITRPVVYGHFSDLAGLLRALVDREGERAVGQLMGLIPNEIDPANPGRVLLGSLRAFLEAVADDPFTWRLVLVPAEGTPEILRERAIQIRAAVTQQLAVVVPQALADPSGPPSPDPELTALTLQAVSEEGARLILESPGEFSIDRVMRHAEWMLGLLGLDLSSP
ncbi:MAG: TetR/AcrR family transcriptional regulator [Solirubrobacterales bacterium]